MEGSLRTRQQRAAFMASLKTGGGSPMTPRKEFEPARAASPTPFVLMAPTTPSKASSQTWRVDYGCFETQGRRDDMEDAHLIAENDYYFMWALFDGHDGKNVSKMLEQTFWKYFIESPYPTVEQKLKSASNRVDRTILSQNLDGGSTAVVCVLEKEGMRVHIYNVGDSECFMVVPSLNWRFDLLSTIHRAQNPREIDRIRMLNATHLVTIEKNRVNGAMEARLCGYGVSRAFGDHKYSKMPYLHADILSCEGDYTVADLRAYPETWLVLHCDGLTECLRHDQVLSLMRERNIDSAGLTAAQVAEILGNAGYAAGSTDNISVVVVRVTNTSYTAPKPTTRTTTPPPLMPPFAPEQLPSNPADTALSPFTTSVSSMPLSPNIAGNPGGQALPVFASVSTPARGRRKLSVSKEQVQFSVSGKNMVTPTPGSLRMSTAMDVDLETN